MHIEIYSYMYMYIYTKVHLAGNLKIFGPAPQVRCATHLDGQGR